MQGRRKTLRERADVAKELFEEFCCSQVGRIEAHLRWRYGRNVGTASNAAIRTSCRQTRDGDRAWLMPQNDHLTTAQIVQECEMEVKK